MRVPGKSLSPMVMARAAGVLYLLTVLLGGVGETLQSRIVVGSDAATIGARVAAGGDVLHLAFALFMVEMTCQVITTAFFYELLRPVNRVISLAAAYVSLVGITIKAGSRLFMLAPLSMPGGAERFTAFNAEQLGALAMQSFQLNAEGAGIGLVFFGCHALLIGWLVLRSTFLPRVLGALSLLGGFGWLTFLYPPYANRVFPIVAGVGLIGAFATIGWLLVKGVDETRWRDQAGPA